MLENLSLQQYTDQLASKASTPGGGSALAVVAGHACALVEMALNVTHNRCQKLGQDRPELLDVAQEFCKMRQTCFVLSEQDVATFKAVLQCNKMPAKTDEQKRRKQQCLQQCYVEASQVPLQLMQLCHKAIATPLPPLYKYVQSDADIGNDLFKCVLKNSIHNVFANTCLLCDQQQKEQLESLAKQLLD